MRLYMKICLPLFFLVTWATRLHAQKLSFEYLTVKEGLPQNTVGSIIKDKYGFMWFGTIAEDPVDHSIWFGTYNTLVRFDRIKNTFEKRSLGTHYAKSGAGYLFFDSKNNLWMGTDYSGLIQIKRNPQTNTFTDTLDYNNAVPNPISPDERTNTITEDETGNVWAGTANGLYRIDPNTNQVTLFTKQDGSSDQYITMLVPDKKGNLWITHKNGLSKLTIKTGEIRNYAVKESFHGYEFMESSGCIDTATGEMYFGGIDFTEALPYKDNYTANVNTGTGTSLNITLDGYPTDRFFINKKLLLGDLYLWKGEYRKAATWYKAIMDISTPSASLETRFGMYKRGWGGNYQVKASQEIIDNWNSQEQRPVAGTGALNGIPYDARGLLSQRAIGGQPTITKFLGNYISLSTTIPVNPLQKNGTWFLFRAAHLHLRFAEAANRDGYPQLAYVLFNAGIRSYNPMPAGQTNITNYSHTLDLPEPYDFDGRMGDIPYFRAPWHRNDGVRSRANLVNYKLTAASLPDSIYQVETGILEEQALETAFEGTRWPDLLRVAIRRDDASFLADKIYNKLIKNPATSGIAAETKAKLLNRNWFLPFKWD